MTASVIPVVINIFATLSGILSPTGHTAPDWGRANVALEPSLRF